MIRLAGLLLVSLFLLAACSDGNDGEQPGDAPSVTPFPTPRPGATAAPGQTPSLSTRTETPVPAVRLSGVFSQPRDVVVARTVELPERPGSPFEAWDGASVVIYDTEKGEAYDFGPGSIGNPAFGRHHLVYTVENEEVYVVDLRTMEEEFVARGILAYFLGDDHIVINPGNNEFFAIDVNTGKRVALEEITEPVLQSMVEQRWGGAFQAEWASGRFVIRRVDNPQAVCEESGAEQRECLADVLSSWVVEDPWAMQVNLAFEANKVESAGPAEIVIATPPVCQEAGRPADCHAVLAKLEGQNPGETDELRVEGSTNIFLVDILTGEATFVATASYNTSTGEWPMRWPMVANEDYVAWTESYCGEPAGRTRIYDRQSGEITEVNTSQWLVLSDGRLGLGEKGATAIIDPGTLEYETVLPELAGVSWSGDLRYAAVGQSFGRAGVCE